MSFVFSFFFPWLAGLLLIQCVARKVKKAPQGWRLTVLFALVSGMLVLLPVQGLALSRWLTGISANFSFPLIAIVFNKAWGNATGSRVLDHKAVRACWIFGLAAGLALYPMALGLGGFDPYTLGWGPSWLFAVLAMATIALLLTKNRFAVVLIACIMGYDLNLLESTNLWDYLVDPFFALFSLGAMSNLLLGRLIKPLVGTRGMDGVGRETACPG